MSRDLLHPLIVSSCNINLRPRDFVITGLGSCLLTPNSEEEINKIWGRAAKGVVPFLPVLPCLIHLEAWDECRGRIRTLNVIGGRDEKGGPNDPRECRENAGDVIVYLVYGFYLGNHPNKDYFISARGSDVT